MAPSTLKHRLQLDVQNAMRANDRRLRDTLRLVLAQIKQAEIDTRTELSDNEIVVLLDKMTKQRRESAEQYRAHQRPELLEQELFELDTLKTYMPEPIDDQALDALIAETIAQCEAQSLRDMGKVMAALKTPLQGRADMAQVSAKIKARLSG